MPAMKTKEIGPKVSKVVAKCTICMKVMNYFGQAYPDTCGSRACLSMYLSKGKLEDI